MSARRLPCLGHLVLFEVDLVGNGFVRLQSWRRLLSHVQKTGSVVSGTKNSCPCSSFLLGQECNLITTCGATRLGEKSISPTLRAHNHAPALLTECLLRLAFADKNSFRIPLAPQKTIRMKFPACDSTARDSLCRFLLPLLPLPQRFMGTIISMVSFLSSLLTIYLQLCSALCYTSTILLSGRRQPCWKKRSERRRRKKETVGRVDERHDAAHPFRPRRWASPTLSMRREKYAKIDAFRPRADPPAAGDR